jgi:glycosyltransferase involved in cell wall biosynthesis
MQKISACLVIHNEEKNIARCLASIKEAVDEIIVVHDGECSDNSLEICRAFGAKIFIREHAGFMEAHLPFCFDQAEGDWLLRIDADEYLSEELKNNLRSLMQDEKVAAYEFLWLIYKDKKSISHNWPHKVCFFRKNKISFLGVIHYLPEISGAIYRSKLELIHQPDYYNFTWQCFRVKWLNWAKAQAANYFKDFSVISKFNYYRSDWPLKIRLRKRYPLLLMPVEFTSTIIKDLLSGGYREFFIGYKSALMYAVYRVMVNYYIFLRKIK